MEKDKKGHNILEKITFAWGLLVTAAVISFLILQIDRKKENPPRLEMTYKFQPHIKTSTYKLEIENMGERTAENVTMKIDLIREGQSIARNTISIYSGSFN